MPPTFIERIISHTSNNIPVSDFIAACRENAGPRDAINWNDIVAAFSLTEAQDTEASEIDALFNTYPYEPVVPIETVEAVLALAHAGVPGYTSGAEVRAKLGLP